MTNSEQDRRKALKRKFILGGIAVGVLLSVGYIVLNLTGRSITGAAAPPDPIGVRFVNVFLIIAASVLQGSILGRVAGFMTRKGIGTK